jgi:hypothetical protein
VLRAVVVLRLRALRLALLQREEKRGDLREGREGGGREREGERTGRRGKEGEGRKAWKKEKDMEAVKRDKEAERKVTA